MSKAPAPATATASAEPLVANAPQATRSEIERKLAALYRERPTISSYVVQDVTYTQESLGAVLQKCTTAGSAVTAQTQSSVLLACAPPIFFLYSFAKQHSVPAALDLADMIYSYAITNIEGPRKLADDSRRDLERLGGGRRIYKEPTSIGAHQPRRCLIGG